MMCGLPFAQRAAAADADRRADAVARRATGGRPIYFTDIVVRADSPHARLEDTFGGVVGYTLADSMSGGVALRDHLAAVPRDERPAPLPRARWAT